MSEYTAEKTLDAKGLKCPMPVVKTRRAIKGMEIGQVLEMIATGVSLNVGVLGLVLSAVDLGYQVVLVRDAVVGVPAEYGESVIANSLGLIATVTTSVELVETWAADVAAAGRADN